MRISVSLAVAASFWRSAQLRARRPPSTPTDVPSPSRRCRRAPAADSGAAADRPVQRLSRAARLRLSGAGRRSAGDGVSAVVSAGLLPVSRAGTGAGLLRAAAERLLLLLPAAAPAAIAWRRAWCARRWDGARRFSFGAHVGFLTLNQQVGKDQVSLGGAGFQLRLRSAGRWGFEASQSFLHGSYWGGAWQRDPSRSGVADVLHLPEQGLAPLQPVWPCRRRARRRQRHAQRREPPAGHPGLHRVRGPRGPRRRAALQVVRHRSRRALH